VRIPRWAVGGVAIFLIGNTVWSAATPDLHHDNPEQATHQQLEERRFVDEERERRSRAGLKARVEAEIAEQARSAEIRPAEATARRAARALTKVVP
jgi:hypothetical protein